MPCPGGPVSQPRILRRGQWWQAHPYSIAALPAGPYLRFTVRELGDHSGSLAQLEPGTRVAIEGPYGAFTLREGGDARIVLVGGGAGMAPVLALVRALAEARSAYEARYRSARDAGWTTEANHLGNVAYRAGKKIEWDYKALRASNAPEADPSIKRPSYRKGWEGILKG